MIDVPKECDHRRPVDQVGRIVFDLLSVGEQLVFDADGFLELDVDAELSRYELRHIRIHYGRNRRHHAFVHEDSQNFRRGHTRRFG